MATAIHMQPPASRPSMDRGPSFDQTRSRSTTPFSHHNRSPSPNVPPQHSRTSSNASASSPYQQPFANNYFPQQSPMYGFQAPPNQGAWTTAAIPANNFYPSPMQLHPGQSFQQGFQQSQADFAAWATAYHQYVAANMANGNGHNGPAGQGPSPQNQHTDFYGGGERRRTTSGPSPSTHLNHPYEHSHSGSQSSAPRNVPQHSSSQQNPPAQGFHPYKRSVSNRTSRENIGASGSLSTSASMSTLSSIDTRHSPANSISNAASPQESHRRTASFESGGPRASVVAPARNASKQDSYHSVRAELDHPERATSTITAVPQTASPAPMAKPAPAASKVTSTTTVAADRPKTSQPLHSGPIANATNTPAISSSRPSPLSQPTSPEPEKAKSGGGLRGRLRRALDKDASTPKKQAPPSTSGYKAASTSKPTFPSPSETSTRSATPPLTPPQHSDLPRPNAPFAVAHPQGMGSDVSLAETERTATAPSEMGQGKQKRSLFRMKNMSTDNISMSSTVSSASMMIRKMGSLGKLARRNSLMGISKIFKDKPKDDDAPLPAKEGKKSKKQAKKDQAKGMAAPAAVSHAIAEPDRFSEDDDRVLAGLSPAAKLARQHTLRSRAEQEKRDRQTGRTGEPAWDNNTATRNNHSGVLPSISAVSGTNAQGAPEVLRITPSRTSTTVHAVQVEDHDFDSDDDSSDGETVENVTAQMGKTRLSDSSAADKEFRETWQSVWIDKNAVPKKGILKTIVSFENMDALASRQRSSSSARSPNAQPGPMVHTTGDAYQVDGVQPKPTTPTPRVTSGREEIIGGDAAKYDPFSASFAPFESPTASAELHFPYSSPAHNSSMPTLSLVNPGAKAMATRSMTAPAKRRLIWAPECSVYSTYDATTYDRRSEPATCNRLTPELAMAIKQELNAFKMEMPVHPDSRGHTHFFA